MVSRQQRDRSPEDSGVAVRQRNDILALLERELKEELKMNDDLSHENEIITNDILEVMEELETLQREMNREMEAQTRLSLALVQVEEEREVLREKMECKDERPQAEADSKESSTRLKLNAAAFERSLLKQDLERLELECDALEQDLTALESGCFSESSMKEPDSQANATWSIASCLMPAKKSFNMGPSGYAKSAPTLYEDFGRASATDNKMDARAEEPSKYPSLSLLHMPHQADLECSMNLSDIVNDTSNEVFCPIRSTSRNQENSILESSPTLYEDFGSRTHRHSTTPPSNDGIREEDNSIDSWSSTRVVVNNAPIESANNKDERSSNPFLLMFNLSTTNNDVLL